MAFDRLQDARIRSAVFDWLATQVDGHGDVLPRVARKWRRHGSVSRAPARSSAASENAQYLDLELVGERPKHILPVLRQTIRNGPDHPKGG